MSVTTTVGGTGLSAKVQVESIVVRQQAQSGGVIATASFMVIDNDASESIVAEDAVVIVDGATTYFKGEVAGTPERWQPAQGTPHGQVRGVADVELLDLRDRGGTQAPGEAALLDGIDEAFTLGLAEGLGVADALDLARVRPHQDSRRDDRRTKRSGAHLVDTHDEALALLP